MDTNETHCANAKKVERVAHVFIFVSNTMYKYQASVVSYYLGHPGNRVFEDAEDIIKEQCNQMTEILKLEKSSKNNASFGWKIEQTR